eukprot:929208-Heterocapsa_arctica.AAC.1
MLSLLFKATPAFAIVGKLLGAHPQDTKQEHGLGRCLAGSSHEDPEALAEHEALMDGSIEGSGVGGAGAEGTDALATPVKHRPTRVSAPAMTGRSASQGPTIGRGEVPIAPKKRKAIPAQLKDRD